jgi:hypothetical protein
MTRGVEFSYLINESGSGVTEVMEVEREVKVDNCDLEIVHSGASRENELNEVMKSSEDSEAEHQRIVAELNTRLNELEADHKRAIEQMNEAHLAEVEKLQAVISQREMEDEAKSVSC